MVLINDSRVSNSIDSLEHCRKVACVSLFCRYYNGRSSRNIWGLVPNNHIFLRSTRISRRAHPFVVDCPVNRILHYRENTFLSALLAYGVIFLRKFFWSVTIPISLNEMSTITTPSLHLPITYLHKPIQCITRVGDIP